VLSTLAAERTDGLTARGHEALSALNSGYHLAYLIAAALTVAAALIAATVLRTDTSTEVESHEAGAPELVTA